MTQGGDSGSLVVAADSLQAVGLLFAGSEQSTIINPFRLCLTARGGPRSANSLKTRPACSHPGWLARFYTQRADPKPRVGVEWFGGEVHQLATWGW
jgi:hypothetical protein